MNIATPDVLQSINSPALKATPSSISSLLSGNSATTGHSRGASSSSDPLNPFGSMLQQRLSKIATDPSANPLSPDADEKARRKTAEDAASGLISNALILPVLKQLRRSPWGGEGVFSGGIGQKTFGPEFDMQLADRIAQSPRLGIKKALADSMMKKGPQAAVKKIGLDVHG